LNLIVATVVTLLQYGGYLFLLLLATIIVNVGIERIIKMYFSHKAAYARELAALAAPGRAQEPDIGQTLEALRKVHEAMEHTEVKS
jgi:hypothetical protein